MGGKYPAKDAIQKRIYDGFRRMLSAGLMEWLGWFGASFIPEEGDVSRKKPARFSPRDKLPALERAKMDHEHCLNLQRLFWDKLVLGAFVGLAVLAATIYMDDRKDKESRSLEKFKLGEAQRQFLLSKRLDALNEVATAMSDAASVYFDHTGKGVKRNATEAEAREEYRKVLDKAEKAIDKAELLFLPGFNADMERYLQVHKAIMRIGVQKCAGEEYEGFMLDLYKRFGEICFEAITAKGGIENWVAKDRPRMPLTFTAKQRRQMTDEQYLNGQLNHWKAHKPR